MIEIILTKRSLYGELHVYVGRPLRCPIKLLLCDHSSDIIADDVFRSLLTFPNVLVTCHQAFLTSDAIREIAHVTLDNVRCFMSAAECANRVVNT